MSRRSIKKALAFLGVAVIALSQAGSAQTRVPAAHAETAAALQCLLEHRREDCSQEFAGSALGAATNWLWWNANKEFALGALKSSDYAGTESANAYTTRFLNGRTADGYDVRFRYQKMTFYIVRRPVRTARYDIC